MSSAHSQTASPNASARESPRDAPTAPDSSTRNRHFAQTPLNGDSLRSPSSTISSSSRVFPPQTPINYSTLGGIGSYLDTPSRSTKIRADPALVTCFDPSDKELYDLWAPK